MPVGSSTELGLGAAMDGFRVIPRKQQRFDPSCLRFPSKADRMLVGQMPVPGASIQTSELANFFASFQR